MSKVNVRALASVYAARVSYLRNSGTTMDITEEVINSAGETWYAVRLMNGTLGYVLGSLLHVDIHYIDEEDDEEEEPEIVYVYITPEPTAVPTPEPAPAVTPETIYVVPRTDATPTPQIVYVTPEPTPEPTPQVIYVDVT